MLKQSFAFLDKAKSEIAAGDIDAAWKTMRRVEDEALSAKNKAEESAINLRLAAESKASREKEGE